MCNKIYGLGSLADIICFEFIYKHTLHPLFILGHALELCTMIALRCSEPQTICGHYKYVESPHSRRTLFKNTARSHTPPVRHISPSRIHTL